MSSSPPLAPPVRHHNSQLLLGVDGVRDLVLNGVTVQRGTTKGVGAGAGR